MIRQHPFAVEAWFRQSLVLTFAVPTAVVAERLPEPFQPDTYQDATAFVAVAMVQTERLRPKGLPGWLGNDFFLAGYRYFVRYTDQRGKSLRGLYILQSQTDSRRMQLLGNLMTGYNYSRIDVTQRQGDERYEVHSRTAPFTITVRNEEQPGLPVGSPFPDWKTACRFAGPLPFTFSYNERQRKVTIVEGVRQNWKPRPVSVEQWDLPWLAETGLGDATLASAFVVENIPYHWRKGRAETWPR